PLTGSISYDKILISLFNPNSDLYTHYDDISINLYSIDKTLSEIKGLFVISAIIFAFIASILTLNLYSVVYIDEEKTIKIFRAMGIRFIELFKILLMMPLTLSIVT